VFHYRGFYWSDSILSSLLIVLILIQTFFTGCGTESPTNTIPDEREEIDVTEASLTIDRDEIGGEELAIVSALDSVRVEVAVESAVMHVSAETAQLLTAVDELGEVRALAISLAPGKVTGVDSVVVDATSTALSLLMLVPGITIANPNSAAGRLDDLGALAAFPALDLLLTHHLPTESIADALAREEVREAVTACVDEFLDLPATKVLSRNALTSFPHFIVEFPEDPTDPAAVVATIYHQAARFTNVYRRELDRNGSTLRTVPVRVGYDALRGINPVDIVFDPGGYHAVIYHDVVDLHCGTGIETVEYWANGAGWGGGGLDPNTNWGLSSDFDRHRDEAALLSAMKYVIEPLLTILAGAFVSSEMIEQLIRIVEGSVVNVQLAAATSPEEFFDAIDALITLQIGFLLSLLLIPWLGLIWSLIQAFLAEILLLGVVMFWSVTPQISMFPLDNPIDQTDCLPIVVATTPTANETGVPLSTLITATFSTDMDPATITTANFTLDQGVTGNVTYDTSSKTATFTPAADLDPGVAYTATVRTAATDLAGLQMANDYSWWFTTSTGNEKWTVAFSVKSRPSCGLSCQTGSSCSCWSCIDCDDAWLLTVGSGRQFLDIEVDVDSGSLLHESSGWGEGANFGTFQIDTASLRLAGTFTDDVYDFGLTLWGMASDRFSCQFFDAPGPFDVTFSITDAVRSGDEITGQFTTTTTIDTPAGNCATIHLEEAVGGTVTVAIEEY